MSVVRGRRRRPPASGAVDLSVTIGSVTLPNPVMTASGTAGHGAELAPYLDLARLGAVVVKSLHAEPIEGNPPLRVHETTAGMINSVGLQGPGVAAWLADDLPALLATGARVVASIWGRSVDEYRRAADLLAGAPAGVVAVEVNLSCPNTEAGRDLFAHSAEATREVLEATGGCGRPRWAKLSPNVSHLPEIAAAACEAGAEAVTLVNTVMGMAIDPEARTFRLGRDRGAGACRARRSTPWRCGRCSTCTPRCPTCRSWASVACGTAATPPSWCWPGRRGCRSGRPRSPTRGRPAGYGTSWNGGRHARACRASRT